MVFLCPNVARKMDGWKAARKAKKERGLDFASWEVDVIFDVALPVGSLRMPACLSVHCLSVTRAAARSKLVNGVLEGEGGSFWKW